MEQIRVQTQSKGDTTSHNGVNKITSKHWKIYYQLMSLSKYNSIDVEDHRFVYKKDINISDLCRKNGIKSNKTFYNAIDRLSQWGLVRDNGKYFLLYAPDWVEVCPSTLTTLLFYAGTAAEHIDLLRVFLILKKMDKMATTADDKSFTARAIIQLLSRGTTNPSSYENVRFYLGMLSYWGLIELKVHKTHDPNIGSYRVYHLQKVKEVELNDFFITDDKAEQNAPLMSDEMMEKLKFQFPSIINGLEN